MIERLERLIFYALIVLLPVQLGIHFWPQFAFINGIRVDYLSPTLYVSDTFILILFLFFIFKIFKKKIKIVVSKEYIFSIIVFLGAIIILFFAAKSPMAHLFVFLKMLEFIFLGTFVAKTFTKSDIPFFIDAISVGSVVSCTLAIWQFVNQSSVGGFWYFLGERSFTKFSTGIALVNFNGTNLLRPYASFAHPNILAFFLLTVVVFVSMRTAWEKGIEKVFLFLVLLLSVGTLLLTFSRTAIFCLIIFWLFYVFNLIKKKKPLYLVLFFLTAVVIYLLYFPARFFKPEILLTDLFYRRDLFLIAYDTFIKNPYLGVGLGNFYIHESFYQKIISPTLLQPVHNIYVLFIVELGIIPFVLIVQIIIDSVRNVFKKIKKSKKEIKDFYLSTFIIFISFLFVGFFDHFLITLQQGELLLAVIIGLSWSNLKIKALASEKEARGADR